MRKIAVISFTVAGNNLAMKIGEALQEDRLRLFSTKKELTEQNSKVEYAAQGAKQWTADMFNNVDALIFIGACGIAVREIAPLIKSKTTDPAVLVADEKGQHIISLLSGHLGGGNELTLEIAEKIGADPVITTSSDVNKKLAIDVWAKKNNLFISNMIKAKKIASHIVENETVKIFCEGEIRGCVPKELEVVNEPLMDEEAFVYVGTKAYKGKGLHLIPACNTVGIGCRKDKDYETILTQLTKALEANNISVKSLEQITSVDLKKDEEGIKKLSQELNIPFITFSSEELSSLEGDFTPSNLVKQVTGVENVCERAAVKGLPIGEQNTSSIIQRKYAENGVTIAITQRKWGVSFE